MQNPQVMIKDYKLKLYPNTINVFIQLCDESVAWVAEHCSRRGHSGYKPRGRKKVEGREEEWFLSLNYME